MKNVIDLTRRLKDKKTQEARDGAVGGSGHAKSKSAGSSGSGEPASVIDMTEARNEILQQERRRVKRTILTEFINAFAVVQGKGLLKVNLYDISEKGLSFDIDKSAGHFSIGEEVAMRVYLSQQTYFGFIVQIQHISSAANDSLFRHGVTFVAGTINSEALHHFVKFIEDVSVSLHSDEGDIMVSNLTR